jgi:hypothetical protein
MFSPLRRMTFFLRSKKVRSPVAVVGDDVAGVEPAAGPRRLGRLGVVEIAREEAGARVVARGADEQFAGSAGRCPGAVVGDDAPRRRWPWAGRCSAAPSGPGLARRGGHGAGPGLGHRPGLDERECRSAPSKRRFSSASAPAPKPKRTAVGALGRFRRRGGAGSPA